MAVQTLDRSQLPSTTRQRLSQKSSRTPPLNAGDRLSRAEFERRYQAHPEITKAELIEGVVHMPSPVHFTLDVYKRQMQIGVTASRRGRLFRRKFTHLLGEHLLSFRPSRPSTLARRHSAPSES